MDKELQSWFCKKLDIMKRFIDEEDFYDHFGKKLKKLNKKDKEKLKNDIAEHAAFFVENFNLQSMENLITFYLHGKEDHPEDPRRYIDLYDAVTTIDEEKRDLLEIMMKKNVTSKQQSDQFAAKTGKSRATYYRKRKEFLKNVKGN